MTDKQPMSEVEMYFFAFIILVPVCVILALLGWAFNVGPFAEESAEHKAERKAKYEEEARERDRAKGEGLHEFLKGAVEGHKK